MMLEFSALHVNVDVDVDVNTRITESSLSSEQQPGWCDVAAEICRVAVSIDLSGWLSVYLYDSRLEMRGGATIYNLALLYK